MALMLMLSVVLNFSLVSCGTDDDELDKGSILGKWEIVSSRDEDYWEKPCVFNFRENNMLTITFAQGKDYEESVPCKYTTNGTYLYIDFAYGDEVFEGTYKIDKNTMTFDMISYDPDYPEDVYEDFLTLKRVK